MKPVAPRLAAALAATLLAAALAAALAGGAAAARHPDARDSGDLDAAIAAFYAAVASGDVEARIALLAEDAVMLPSHWTPAAGKADIAAMLRSGAGWVFRIQDREEVRRWVDGDLAVTVNRYAYTWHREGDAPQWHRTKNVHVWRRGADGAWRQQLDIWNSDVPLAAFAGEGKPPADD
ncbi:MAG: nuclear transport factor 2 family protein [Candidatus Krumholzibacteriota bacterium]|nr:nuclear transport factor 2 family protein [Candidatus Krumholzibacteriota bacterium]